MGRFFLITLVFLVFSGFSIIPDSEANKPIVVELISHSFKAGRKSFFNVGEQSQRLRRGITLVHFNSSETYEFRIFDTYGDKTDLKECMYALEKMIQDKATFAILVHDSATEIPFKNAGQLSQLGLKKLGQLKNREAYVMHNLDGNTNEFIDEAAVVLKVELPSIIKSETIYFPKETYEFEPATDRFIAHAGGEINGHAYTNTQNALDESYAKGFRLFELDIIQTADGHFVAAHDWNMWSRFTEYDGQLPPTLETFKKETIYGDYHTMDMEAINAWFETHKDAILVTDKIADAMGFAEAFVDKKRLIMELFSPMAIEEAAQKGITVMISQKPLLALEKGTELNFLKVNNVKYAGVSRRIIERKKKLMKQLRDNGIKVYVYNVNFDQGKDEKYVYENEIGLVYGMYADKWVFGEQPKKPNAQQ